MKIALRAFTNQGSALLSMLADKLGQQGHQILPNAAKLSLSQWAAWSFAEADALVFVGASGIAVRAVAPYLVSKATDPAVVVVDDAATWSISLVSGHLGGANALAREIARISGAEAVITTATDVNKVFAVDVWAQQNNLFIDNLVAAKHVAAALLAGSEVAFFSELPYRGDLPDGLAEIGGREAQDSGVRKKYDTIIIVSPFDIQSSMQKIAALAFENFSCVLHLIPRTTVLGIGCRRGISLDAVTGAVSAAFAQLHLDHRSLASCASISLKSDEPALLEFCAAAELPFVVFSAAELAALPGDFSASDFVKQTTGVDSVCERAAFAASDRGRFLLRKTAREGVTLAICETGQTLAFSAGAPGKGAAVCSGIPV